MARTTWEQVAEIIELDGTLIPDATALTPFIIVANELVTELCTGAAGPTIAYTASRLELIERWLSAHFYTNLDPRSVTEKAGSVSVTFQSMVDLGLDTSHYGQTAMRLDTNGGLAKLNDEAKSGGVTKATADWMGHPSTCTLPDSPSTAGVPSNPPTGDGCFLSEYDPTKEYFPGEIVVFWGLLPFACVAQTGPGLFDPAAWICQRSDLKSSIVSGGSVSIPPGALNTFNITETRYFIVDTSDYAAPLVIPIVLPAATGVVNEHYTTSVTYLSLDRTGALIQRPPGRTSRQEADEVVLGHLVNGTPIVAHEQDSFYGRTKALIAYMRSVGGVNDSGSVLSEGPSGLSLSASAGSNLVIGGSFDSDGDNPNQAFDTATIGFGEGHVFQVWIEGEPAAPDEGTFHKALATGGLLDPTKYNPNGNTRENVPAGKVTIRRIFYVPGNKDVVIYDGRKLYDGVDEAVQLIDSDPFKEHSTTRAIMVFRGYVILRTDATDWADPRKARLVATASGAFPSMHRGRPTITFATTAPRQETGFVPSEPDRNTYTTLAFVDLTRIFTITPAGDSFAYFRTGLEHANTSLVNHAIGDIEGWHHVFFSNGTLTSEANVTRVRESEILTNEVLVGRVYWNATDKKAEIVADHRYDIETPGAVRDGFYAYHGMVHKSGLALTDLITDGDGDTDAHAQFGVASGTLFDLGITHTIGGVLSTIGTRTLYLSGPGYLREVVSPNAVPNFSIAVAGSGRAAFNEFIDPNWQLTEATSGQFVHYYIFASSNLGGGMVTVVGQREFALAADAREAAPTAIYDLAVFSGFRDLVPIATVIVQTKLDYTNAVRSKIVPYIEAAPGQPVVHYVDHRGAANIAGGLGGSPGGGDALTSNPLSQFATTTSAQLAGVMSDETGTGALVFATSPVLVTPALGTPASGDLSNCLNTNWDTAFGWGDHASAGYLTTETNDLTASVTWANIPIANVPTGTTGVTVALGNHVHTGVYDPAGTAAAGDAAHLFDYAHDAIHAELHTIESHDGTSATGAELNELTDGGPTTLHSHDVGLTTTLTLRCISRTDGLVVGDDLNSIFIPPDLDGMNLLTASGSVHGASSSGDITVQIHRIRGYVDMLSTPITITAGQNTSSAFVIDLANDDVVAGDELRVDVIGAGTGTLGLDVTMGFDAQVAQTTVAVRCIARTTALVAGNDLTSTFLSPNLDGKNLTAVWIAVYGPSSAGPVSIQIHRIRGGVSVLSTPVTIDAGESTSSTASVPVVIDTANDDVVAGDEYRVDVIGAGTGTLGLDVVLSFEEP